MKKILAVVMIAMIIGFGISIERDISVVDTANPYDKYINYNMSVKPENLVLTEDFNTREKDLLVNLFQGLVKEDNEGNIVGALAEKVEISENGLEYNFQLRNDIYYSTGEKIESKDFVEFFKVFLSDKDNVYRNDLDFIFGVKDYREGKVDFSQVAIIAKEDMITIRLNNPCPYFLEILAHPVYALRDYAKLKEYEKSYKGIRYTGPFVIKDILNKDLILEKNQRYYNSKEVTGDLIRVSFIESSEDALAIFEDTSNKTKNKVDIMQDVPVNEVFRLSEENMIKDFSGNETLILSFNEEEENPASTVEFRTALNDSLNREQCAETVSEELLNPIYSSVGEKEEGVEVFKPLLQSNMKGYFESLKEENDLKIKLIYEDNSLQRRVAKELTEKLSKETGVEFIPVGYSSDELQKILSDGDYNIYLSIFQFKYNSEFEYFKAAADNEGNEECNIKLQKALYIVDKEGIRNELVQCEQLLAQNLSQIPLYDINNIVCFKKDFDGFYVNRYGNINLENIKRVRF